MKSRAYEKAWLFSLTDIVLLLVLCPHEIVSAAERFCPEEASVDLTDASQNATGFLSKTGHLFTIDVARNTTDAFFGCMCDIKTCVSVCSPLVDVDEPEISGPEYFSNDSVEIPPVYTTDLTLEDDEYSLKSNDRFYVFTWDPCKGGQAYSLELYWYEIDVWYLLRNGSLFFPNGNGTDGTFLDWRKYCFLQNRNHTANTPVACYHEAKPARITLYIGGFLGPAFLIATIFVYSVSPELGNLHGTTFRCYLCCLLVFHVTLATSKIFILYNGIEIVRLVVVFAIHFSVFASFLWLNVICFDMWWKFGGYGSLRNRGKPHDREKFIRYSIYVWGTATVLAAISNSLLYLIDHTKLTNTSNLVSFILLLIYGTICVTVGCNICLFLSTSITLFHHKKNARRQLSQEENQRHGNNMALFSLYFKLSVVMIFSWPMDVIPQPWEAPEYALYLMDMVNTLQSMLIFVLFACKRKIWQSLKTRCKRCHKSNHPDALRFNEVQTLSRLSSHDSTYNQTYA